MAFMHVFIVVAIVAAIAAPTLATDFVVGDYSGWTLNFDYQTWAKGKVFHVGDKLIFKYQPGVHNVYRVNGTAFQECAPPELSAPLTSGYDVITLATPGKKWYICGVGNHCQTGNMKLAIFVYPQFGSPTAPAPTPIYDSTSSDLTPTWPVTPAPAPAPTPIADWTPSDLAPAWSPM